MGNWRVVKMNDKDRERFGIMESQITDLRKDVRGLHSTMQEFIDKADQRYASKDRVRRLEENIQKKFDNAEGQGWLWVPKQPLAYCLLQP